MLLEVTDTAATPKLVMGIAATSTLATATVATQTPATQTPAISYADTGISHHCTEEIHRKNHLAWKRKESQGHYHCERCGQR